MALHSKCQISVTVLTKNEEALIERCIRSLSWADEVLIVDSGSTDATRRIATQLGAVVREQPWLGWIGQHQAALDMARHDWVLVIDADEIVSAELARGIMAVMDGQPDPQDGYVLDRRDELFGRLLPNMKRKSLREDFIRLFNRTRSHYKSEELIHETVACPGRRIHLPGILLHWRNVTFMDAMQKDLENAELEAKGMQDAGVRVGVMRILFAPVARFVWCYAVKGGFRVGMTGLIYSMMRAHAEFLRNVRLWELQNAAPILHPPADIWNLSDMPAVEDPRIKATSPNLNSLSSLTSHE